VDSDKQAVKDFWEDASCGERLYLQGRDATAFQRHSQIRYQLEPEILAFAEFHRWKGRRVLEIGVGLGSDHQKFAEAGADLYGVDLTERAVDNTKNRFQCLGLTSILQSCDAEKLPFSDGFFDLVYSWGVLHVTPNTPKAFDEVYRVLKPGGTAKIMIYHTYSMVGYMLWLRYGLLRLRPLTSLATIYHHYLESLGTKAYTVEQARAMCHRFKQVTIDTFLTHGDLLTSAAGQRHEGWMLQLARRIWPRALIRRWFPKHGLFMTIEATK